MNNVSSEKLRDILYETIQYSPGITKEKIQKYLKINNTAIEKGLQILKEEGILSISVKKGYTQYFIKKKKLKIRLTEHLSIRHQIYELVRKNPGLHLSKIAKMLDISIQLADYHLVTLERNGKIVSRKDDKQYIKQYFTIDSGVNIREKEIIEVLRKQLSLRIILLLLKYKSMRHKELLSHLDVVSSTLSYHLTGLVKNDIIMVKRDNHVERYFIKNQDEILRVIKKHRFHIAFHYILETYVEAWKDLEY